MEIKSHCGPVGKLFQFPLAYRVPAYQRAYSWEQLEIEDFVRDLEVCYDKRKYSDPVDHFFGQIVCIGELQGSNQDKPYELVDGQQRMVTFVLLVYALINTYKEIIKVDQWDDHGSGNQREVLNGRIKQLYQRYLVFKKEINDEFSDVNVLELSNRDRIFFKSFISDISAVAESESHKLIKSAYELIYKKIHDLTYTTGLKDRIGNLKTIQDILDSDFHLLNMITSDRKAAFKLFQVMNNRGKDLTEGDLLRAECLRMLDPYRNEQVIVEETWDKILIDLPEETEQYLRAIYGSYTGQKAGTHSLFIEFLTKFFPEYSNDHIDATSATRIKDWVQVMKADIVVLRKVSAGEWPYEYRAPVEQWDRDRLYLLMVALGHRECLAFLLSARILPHTIFSEIIKILERFVFRYLIIGNQYIGDLLVIYDEEAKKIRDNPAGYTVVALKARLQPLMDKVDDGQFKRLLEDFKYSRTGRSNKPMKYFLLSLAYYYQWYIDGAKDSPKYTESQVLCQFDDSSIEHIYPHNGVGAIVNADLELLKNNLGNLTILSKQDNQTVDNDDFAKKRLVFEASSLAINREDIAKRPKWDKQVVMDRTEEIKKMACAIFML